MKDEKRTKEETLEEPTELRRSVSELAGDRDGSDGQGAPLDNNDLKYTTLIKSLPQKVFLKDADSVYVSCNEKYARDLKISPAEIAGKTDYDFFPKELADKYRADDRRIMDSGKAEEVDERYVSDTGEVYVHTVKAPVKNEEGEVVGILGIFWDLGRSELGEESPGKAPGEMGLSVAKSASELLKANELLRMEIEERKRVEAALTESEATLRSILTAAPTGIGLVKERVLLWVSEQTKYMLGYTDDDLVGQSARMLYEDEEEFERIGRVKYGDIDVKGIGEVETRWVRKDGAVLDILLRSAAIDPDDISRGVIFSALDITERNRAQEALKWELEVNEALSELYKTIISPFSSILDITRTILDRAKALTGSLHGFVSEIDPETGHNVGHTLTEMMGDRCAVAESERKTVFPRADDGTYPGLWGHALNSLEGFFTNDPGSHEFYAGLPRGHIPLRSFLTVPVLLGDELVGQIALANKEEDYNDRDLRAAERLAEFYALAIQRKRAEEALKESELRYRNVVEDQTEMICRYLPDGTLNFVNRAYARYFGFSPGELVGSDFRPTVPDSDKPKVEAHFAAMSPDNPVSTHEHRMVLPRGRTAWTQWTDRAIYDDEGRLVEFQSVGRDVTDRKRAEEALKESMKKLETFASSVMHDLKSPATSIHGLARMLERQYGDVLDEKGGNYLKQILKVSEHIAALVDNINVFISTRQNPLKIERVDVSEILESVREEFSEQLVERNIRWLESQDMPEVFGDKLSIHRVFRNFVDNALKYGGEELSEIRVDYDDTEALHIFSVSDDGAGIKEEDTDKLFGPFQRKVASTSGGSGLGLAIVREIAEQHQGEVWADAEEEGGMTFYISISKDLRPEDKHRTAR